jgi:hypothetical protein
MTNPNATLADELEACPDVLRAYLQPVGPDKTQFLVPKSLRDTILAALRTPAPAIVTEALKYADMEICRHEETHRGGVLWTICDACGMKWADDQGGFKPSPWPAMYDKAIAALQAQPAQAQGDDVERDNAFCASVQEALKGDHTDLQKEAIILRAHRAALAAMQQAPRCVSQNQSNDTQAGLCEAGETQDQQAPMSDDVRELVKPLRWSEPHPSVSYPNWYASNLVMQFEARIDTSRAACFGKFPLRINGYDSGQKFETLGEAKAYAEADYKERVLSLLNTRLTQPQADAAVAVEQWQPIETAPRDGSRFLVWEKHYGIRIGRCKERADHDDWLSYMDAFDGSSKGGPRATHWMPLPTPPAAIRAGGQP